MTTRITDVPEYWSWRGMKSRCLNPNNVAYARYGGRGITINPRWLEPRNGLWNFIDDMGKKPSPRHSIERIDNEKGYDPDNCKWATRAEQSRNKSSNVSITYNGTTKLLIEWAEYLGVRPAFLRDRIKRGWSPDKAIETPKVSPNDIWRYRKKKIYVLKTHCHRGHEFNTENTWVGKKGNRQCRACLRLNRKKTRKPQQTAPSKNRIIKT